MTQHAFTITLEHNPLWAEPLLVARLDSCEAHLARFGNELNIQFISSEIPNRGHANGLISSLLTYCKKEGLTLVSSTPISEAWEHLCRKFDLPVYYDGLPGPVTIKQLQELEVASPSRS